ncbi:MAG: magnesium transporter [Dehalococcoidales bacterium]|jgi:magnesium transporter|nr:magnesium transporter [Dehalococcoidales bacterium]NLT28518.1 magnesium transporter [Dehalococcoidales bacterium]
MEEMNIDAFKELLAEKNYKVLREKLLETEPESIAELLDSIPDDKAVIVFRLLPKTLAVDVFDYMDSSLQNRLLESFSDQAARTFLEAMPPDDRIELLEEAPANVARRLLQILSPEQRRLTVHLLGYQEDTAGREMTPYFVDLHGFMTVEQALERIRELAINRETIYVCYVMDRGRHLIGTVSLRDLVTADPQSRISDIMTPEPLFVYTNTDREEVAKILRERELIAIPVVDAEERLVGILTYDDVVDIIEEETTEDIYRFGAVQGTERSYFTSRILDVVKNRAVWLFLLILVNMLTGSIIAGQEALLGEMVILAAFIPLLIGTGGNVGAQSATVVIRGLATGEVNPKKALAVIGRESLVGIVLGLALGAAVLVLAYILGRDLMVAGVVTFTLIVISLIATIIGGALPFAFRLVKLDPALVSAPFISTVMDIFGVFLYFLVANIMFTI